MTGDIILHIFIFLALYIQIFLLISIFTSKKKTQITTLTFPKVCIIVPCFNEERTVAKTIQSLLNLNYPKNSLEIIVVDDGSKDRTFEISKKFENNNSGNKIKVITQENSGKYTALNKGISITDAEFIGCLDADSEVNSDALKNMIGYFKNPKIAAVTPIMLVKSPKTPIQYLQRVEYHIGVFIKWAHSSINAIHVTPGPFSIFRKEIIKKIGGFKHAHNTEDMEIAFRIQENGYIIENCPSAKVITVTPDTFKKLYKQRVRWTYGFLKNAIDYKHLFFNKKYGNIGFATLPFSVLSAISGLYLFSFLVLNLINFVIEKIVIWNTIGIHFYLPSFSWFRIDTSSIFFLSLTLISLAFVFALSGKKMSGEKPIPSLDMIVFSMVYGLIAPIWLIKAVYNVALAKKTAWR